MFFIFALFLPHYLLSFVYCEVKEELMKCVNFDSCQCSVDFKEFSCRTSGFLDIPEYLPNNIIKLDLTSNNLTEIHKNSFSRFQELEELILSDNKLELIHPRAFSQNGRLKKLFLQSCSLQEFPTEALSYLPKLATLHIGQNELTTLEENSLLTLTQLRSLRLDGNRFTEVPTSSLNSLPLLEMLNLGNNMITSIPFDSFPQTNELLVLLLRRNQISKIDEDAFVNLTSLRVLELDDNLLTEIPTAITKLPTLQELSVSGNKIKFIPSGILQKTPGLALLELKGNPLAGVDPHAFSHLPKLRKLILSDAKDLTTFPSLNGTGALEILRLDRSGLTGVPTSLCVTSPKLKNLDMKSNKLTKIPDLSKCKEMRVLYLLSHYSQNEELYLGCRYSHPDIMKGFMVGKAGYVLSKEAIQKIAIVLVHHYPKILPDYHGFMKADEKFGWLMEKIEINFIDTRDSFGKERFHPFDPKTHAYEIKTNNSDILNFYNNRFYKNDENGYYFPGCCSETSITFGNISPAQMYVLEYMIYSLRPFGIVTY